jgi:serine-type D-Ala-D-Ala carboxypeptidase/endopeptidase
LAFSFSATAEDFTNAIAAYLQYYVHARLPHGCMVVGIVDEHGSSVISAGDLDNGTDRQADGDTIFHLESATLTFFDLLLQDMVDRGQVQPDDPVQKYLPASARMPTYNGIQITVRQVARETSGLRPSFAGAIAPKRADDPLEGLTAVKFLDVVSKCKLTSAPGTTHMHPSINRGVLNLAMARIAGTDIESLLTTRIFGPLQMNDSRITLTTEQESRLAPEHSKSGYALPEWHFDFKPLDGLNSTADDLLKFLTACTTSSHVLPLWDNTVSNFAFTRPRAGMLQTGGGWFFNGCFIGFNKVRRRGVVILSNAYEPRSDLGFLLLDSEWQSDRRPLSVKVSSQLCASYAGQYQREPDYALGMFALQHYVFNRPKTATLLPVGLCLAALAVLLWRVGNNRKRLLILVYFVLAGALAVPLLPVLSSRIFCACLHPSIGIRSEGDRLFAENLNPNCYSIEDWSSAQVWRQNDHPIDVLFPPVPVELLAESETNFFERLSCVPMTFSRNANGKVTGLVLHYHGKVVRYDRISNAVPKAPEPVNPPVIVKLDTNHLDACVGRYELAPDSVSRVGIKLTVWRVGQQLLAQVQGDGYLAGAFPLFPESETNFLEKLTGDQFRFIKNERGQVTTVIHHSTGETLVWFPGWKAKKLE